jgi:ATP-dependent Clp protease ATP-binding subunit ClpA
MASMTEPVPTPRYQRLVAAASEIATDWGHEYVGTEHLFLAIIGDRHAVPTQVLARLTDVDRVAAELRALMESDGYKTPSRRVARPPERE